MKRTTLRELAKFASGLIAGDFLCGLWLYFNGLVPITFWGISFTPTRIILWMIFDVIVFLFLVHYAWRMEEGSRSNGERLFHNVAGTLFTIVALLHLSRIIFGWQFSLGSWAIPYWLNGLAAVITLFLAYASFHFAKRR